MTSSQQYPGNKSENKNKNFKQKKIPLKTQRVNKIVTKSFSHLSIKLIPQRKWYEKLKYSEFQEDIQSLTNRTNVMESFNFPTKCGAFQFKSIFSAKIMNLGSN